MVNVASGPGGFSGSRGRGIPADRRREVLLSNIRIGKILADFIKTSLGPLGMSKLILGKDQDLVATTDGGTILRWLNLMGIAPPVAKMLIEAARSQELEFGDGCISTVLLAGELLSKAEELVNLGFHPSIIMAGYKKALEKAIELLRKISMKIPLTEREVVSKVVETSLKRRFPQDDVNQLTELILNAAFKAAEIDGGKRDLDFEHVKVVSAPGGSLRDSYVIDGVVLDKKGLDPNMPKRIENAKIALLSVPIEINRAKLIKRNAKTVINSPKD